MDKPFEGDVLVFTGKLNSYTREQAQKISEENGACIKRNVSNQTTLVVVGAFNGKKKTSCKLQKAKEKEIKCINEQEFERKLKKA